MLDDTLLESFAKEFYGYGDYNGPYWFIGMEEGGGGTCDEVQGRLDAWNTEGRRHELEDLAGFHKAIGQTNYFTCPVSLQTTWKALIRILLSGSGAAYSVPDIKKYQKCELGRWEKRTVLSELLPLPSQSTKHWRYNCWSKLPQLKSKKAYMAHYLPTRKEHIRQRIATYKPQLVVFYGLAFKPHWEEIADSPFIDVTEPGFAVAITQHTIYALVKHPAAFGVSTAYFDGVGMEVAKRLGAKLTPWTVAPVP